VQPLWNCEEKKPYFEEKSIKEFEIQFKQFMHIPSSSREKFWYQNQVNRVSLRQVIAFLYPDTEFWRVLDIKGACHANILPTKKFFRLLEMGERMPALPRYI